MRNRERIARRLAETKRTIANLKRERSLLARLGKVERLIKVETYINLLSVRINGNGNGNGV